MSNKTKDSKDSIDNSSAFQWKAEFMAGPGGFLEKEIIYSDDIFKSPEDAKDDALVKAENEVCDYPYSRGKILKLEVVDKNGASVIVLKNAIKDVPRR